MRVEGGAANELGHEGKRMPKFRRDSVEHTFALGHDLGTDAVAT
jgi:hypothetical protein